MAIDLLKLEKRFIDLLENTTQEEFEQWLLSKTESKPMAQQTAMEQFIEWIDSDCTPMDCVMKAKELLKTEKKQMEKAYIQPLFSDCQTFDQYYTQTYGNNQNK